MKEWIVVAAAAVALAGCKAKNEEPAPAASATSAMAPAATSSSNVASPGTYEVTDTAGKVITEAIKADGTYSDTQNGKQIATGTWRTEGDKTCFTEKGKKEVCYTAGALGADGTFAVMGPDGKKAATVKKVA